MKKLVLLAALIFSASLVMAAGGNVREKNPIFNIDGDIIGSIVPVPEGCTVYVPPSGKAVYLFCDEDDE